MEPGLREGRGFSIPEIREVGLSIKEAQLLGIPVDKRRRSKWEWNIEALRKYLNELGYKPRGQPN